MTSKTLLDTVRAVTGEIGFSQPESVASSGVLTDIQLKYLTIAACDELLEAHDWQHLLKRGTFVVQTGVSLYDLPDDFQRFVNTTLFVDTEEGDGQSTTYRWLRMPGGEKTYRLIGNQIELFESESYVGQTVAFNYISNFYVLDGGGGIPKAEFSLDSDKTVFHPRLLISFVKLKLLQTKNLDTRAAAQDFNSFLEAAQGADTPSRVLTMDGEITTINDFNTWGY